MAATGQASARGAAQLAPARAAKSSTGVMAAVANTTNQARGATVTAVQVVFPAAQLESAEAATEFEDRLGRKGIIVENARAATLAVSISTRVVAQTTSVTANDARTGFGIASAVQTDTARGIMAAAAQAAASAATQLETVEVTTEFADFLGPQGIVVENAMAVTSADGRATTAAAQATSITANDAGISFSAANAVRTDTARGTAATAVQGLLDAVQLETAEAATEFEDLHGSRGFIVGNAIADTFAVGSRYNTSSSASRINNGQRYRDRHRRYQRGQD